jgi:alpha-methylacyl-CoA racemase
MADGPLAGLKIIEIAGIGPAPFCGMMLADHGADVIRVDRPGGVGAGSGGDPSLDPLQRSRRSLVLDLKDPQAIETLRALIRTADGLIEGFRPGVMERLGLGPDVLLADNPRLAYGRITGWGQDGPWAQKAGHDINYIALSGTLNAVGEAGRKPTVPLNLAADFGGGGMLLAFGMLAALLSAQRTGKGQVVDAAMTEGSALLMAMTWGFRSAGIWRDERGTNRLDGGSHYYDSYRTLDDKYVAIGAIEPQFYAALGRVLGLDADFDLARQKDPKAWAGLKEKIAAVIGGQSRAHWDAAFEGVDACYAPVLDYEEALAHPHNVHREMFATIGGVTQPMPAPRYSLSDVVLPSMAGTPGQDGRAILSEIGLSDEPVDRVEGSGR